jgi:hypothetical protein
MMKVDAWLVVSQWAGSEAKYVTVDRAAAEAYAVRQAGQLFPLQTQDPDSEKSDAWLVVFPWGGAEAKYVTLDEKAGAAYATKRCGKIFPLAVPQPTR